MGKLSDGTHHDIVFSGKSMSRASGSGQWESHKSVGFSVFSDRPCCTVPEFDQTSPFDDWKIQGLSPFARTTLEV